MPTGEHPPHPDDVVLLVKQWVHGNTLSQPPMVILPYQARTKLDGAKLKPMIKTNRLSPTELREFRKAAKGFAEEPWRMIRTKAYLEEWCKRNEEQDFIPPKPVLFVMSSYPARGERMVQLPDLIRDFATKPPRTVEVAVMPSHVKATLVRARQAPMAKAKPVVKATAKPASKAKAKAAGKAKADTKRVPAVEDAPGETGEHKLGCSKCRYASTGCGVCRTRQVRARKTMAA